MTDDIRLEVFGHSLHLETTTEAYFIADVRKDEIPLEVKAILKAITSMIPTKDFLS